MRNLRGAKAVDLAGGDPGNLKEDQMLSIKTKVNWKVLLCRQLAPSSANRDTLMKKRGIVATKIEGKGRGGELIKKFVNLLCPDSPNNV